MAEIKSERHTMFVPMLWRNAADNTLTESLRGMDRFFDEVFAPAGMATDIIEEEQNYRLEAELPGYDKADIHMALKDGNLEISAARNEDRDQKDSAGRTVRRERRTASCRRSFRVGQGVTPEDIQAKFENGVLTVVIPKKDAVPERETGRIEIQ
jgi:HSP20 family molecular chaperone IbpA